MNEMTWGLPVILYLFLAGLGAGSFCLGTIAAKKKGFEWEACSRMAFLLSPVAIAVGLLMLILDLRYKLRFWRTLTVLNAQSPMSIGVWLLTAFFTISFITAVLSLPFAGRLVTRQREKIRNILGNIGIPFALGISVYTGVLLSSTAIPLWRNLSLPLLFCISALSLGIEGGAILGMMSLREKSVGQMAAPLQFLRRSYRIMLPIYLFAALLFVLLLLVAPSSKAEAIRLLSGWNGAVWWVGVVGIGIVAPLVLLVKEGKGPMKHAWIFSSCLLFGDFLLRYVLIMTGQGAI